MAYKKTLPVSSILIALLLLPAASTTAKEIPNLNKLKAVVPDQIAGVTTIDADQVIELLVLDKPPLLIDARIKKDRDYGYIKSSISLPDIETNCDSLVKIAPDKNQHLMFYCNGVQCGRSVVSIKVARSCGYHKLSWFREGFSQWKEKGYQYIQSK